MFIAYLHCFWWNKFSKKNNWGYHPEVGRRQSLELSLNTNYHFVQAATQGCFVRKLFWRLFHGLLKSCPIATIVVIGQEFSNIWNSFLKIIFWMFGLQKETVFYVSVAIRNTCLDLVCGLQCHSPCLYPSLPVCYGQYRHARRISDSEGKNQ